MTRLALRARLTVVFATVMALVLLAVGGGVFLVTKQNIDRSIAQSLRARDGALREFAAHPPRHAKSLIPPGERYAQLQRLDGSVIESRPPGERPMLTPRNLRKALQRPHIFELHERVRYLASRTRVHGHAAIAVAATSLAQHEQALEGLTAALVIGGLLALVSGAGIAYAVAAGALRPIEAMRRRAASISDATPEGRLPVPPVDDEVRRLAQTLNAMLDRLAASAAVERRLIANASHELRTPLAALQADLELALRPGVAASELRGTVGRALEDAARLSALSDSLLDLSRQEERHDRQLETVAVAALFERVAHALERGAATEGRAIIVRPTTVSVEGDPDELLRAVMNLVQNALLHGKGTIRLTGDETHDSVLVNVEDEGTLTSQAAEIAFERFARGPDAAGRPGAGLGLPLVRAIARQHGGDATLQNFDGGVRATIRLPRPSQPTR